MMVCVSTPRLINVGVCIKTQRLIRVLAEGFGVVCKGSNLIRMHSLKTNMRMKMILCMWVHVRVCSCLCGSLSKNAGGEHT